MIIEQILELPSFQPGRIEVLLHSLAFGTLTTLVDPPDSKGRQVRRRQLDMTMDVMANSLVYWVQDLVGGGLLATGPASGGPGGARVFAMTSSGSHTVWPDYGPVSAAKAALEAHVRQLALELGPHGIAINAVMAGVTRTPALLKIPGHERLMSPGHRQEPPPAPHPARGRRGLPGRARPARDLLADGQHPARRRRRGLLCISYAYRRVGPSGCC